MCDAPVVGAMMRVALPLAGRFRMLRWHTGRDGHHVVLARTHEAVRRAFAHLDHEKIEIRGYWDIELRAPSEAMHREAREVHAKRVRSEFWDGLRGGLVGYHIELPLHGLSWCHNDEYHYETCGRCELTSGLLHSDPERFFLDRVVMSAKPKVALIGPERGFASRARSLLDGEEAMAAYDDRGHHRSGVALEDLYDGPDYAYHAVYGILFLYSVIEDLPTVEFDQILGEVRERATVREALRHEEAKRYHDARDEERRIALLALISHHESSGSGSIESGRSG